MNPLNATLIVPGDHNTTLHYCADHFVTLCRDAIADHGFFAVALAGGSTPREIYEILCQPPCSTEIAWDKVHLFWSDERAALPTHPDSNYFMAMKAGFEKMPIPPHHIHRMVAEEEIQLNAQKYEHEIRTVLDEQAFDLVMLGMGEDGHTASLFPSTEGLHTTDRLVIANYIPSKKSWRMTLTFEALNDAWATVFYVFGAPKADMLAHVFSSDPHLPCQKVGTPDHPALWIADEAAAGVLGKS